jgi:geranylgeranyl reductase family protein
VTTPADATSAPVDGTVVHADVVVVGAGPGGSATAAWLAKAGRDVVLLEKSAFPRDKICGDGLTPRAVRQLIELEVPTEETDGWARNKGLRIIGGGMRLQLDWPEVDSFPSYGMVRGREDLDEFLARHAERCGATLVERRNVTEPVLDAAGRIVGVVAKVMGENGRATGEKITYRAPVVVAADGVSSRLAVAMGREKREDRPMGVAVRAYYETPRHTDDYMESHLELWTKGESGQDILMPGYGWLFGVGDGRSNIGLGILNTSEAFGKTDYKDVMRRWVESMPAEWGISEATITGGFGFAALSVGTSLVVGPKRYNRAKAEAYECGIQPTPAGRRWRPRPGQVLPHGDALHHLRHRVDLPLPLRGRLRPARPLRPGRNGPLHPHRLRRLRLRVEARRARVGLIRMP